MLDPALTEKVVEVAVMVSLSRAPRGWSPVHGKPGSTDRTLARHTELVSAGSMLLEESGPGLGSSV